MGELLQQFRSDANLLAYFRLNGNTNDYLGGTALTQVGSPSFQTGKFGTAMNLGTGGGKYAHIASNYSTTVNQAKSISLWFNVNAQPSANDWNTFAAISYSAGDIFYYVAYANDAGTFRLRFTRDRYNTSRTDVNYNVTIANGGWHHTALVWSGTQMSGYYDGSLVAGPTTIALANGADGAPDRFVIGSTPDLNARYGQAIIDDVGLFGDALTSTEVLKMYRQGPTGGFMFF